MEIGALSSPSYLPAQPVEPRVARAATREAFSQPQEQIAASSRSRNEGSSQNPVFNVSSEKTAEIRTVTESQAAKNSGIDRDKKQAASAQDAQQTRKPEIAVSVAGSIKMEVEEGNRVLKVFDSKEVLIYQLPPKGELLLIKAQEHAQQSQVQTSA